VRDTAAHGKNHDFSLRLSTSSAALSAAASSGDNAGHRCWQHCLRRDLDGSAPIQNSPIETHESPSSEAHGSAVKAVRGKAALVPRY